MKRYLLMSILSIIAITGCESDKLSNTDNQEVVWKVSRLVFDDFYYGFKYDSQDRMSQIIFGEVAGDEEIMARVFYEGNEVTKLLEDVNVTYELDAKGRVVKASPTFLRSYDDEEDDDYEVFEYGTNGYISRVTGPLMPDCEFEVTNGNYTRMSVNGSGLSIEYTEYPNNYSIDMNYYLLNSATLTPFYCLWFSKFPGTVCQNLIKRISGSDNVVTYYYTFDAAGRVSSITMNKSYGDGENIIAGMTVQYEE